MDQAQKIETIRAELPAVTRYAYLNTGTNGPLPRRAHEKLVAHALRDLERGRIHPDGFKDMFQTFQETRETMAEALGCDPLDIALTHSTTEGINAALTGLDWRPGDEIITSVTEHPGVLYPVYQLKQRHGVRIRMTRIGMGDVDSIQELKDAITPRTRAVALSHVSWSTGMTLPIAELASITHRAGALFICDAAQSCGMVPSRMHELDVDAYACSGQKWLCGPEGTGALYVRRDRLGDIRQTFMGYRSVRAGMSDLEGHFVPPEGALRYEATTINPATAAALTSSVRWIADEVGWTWAFGRIANLGKLCYEALSGMDHITILTPRDHMAGLIHFNVANIAPTDVVAQLTEQNILARSTPAPAAVRVSLGFYTTEADIERLISALSALHV